MAPRRRPKVGSSRMDAALDAMRPMGFSSPVVRKCVRNLLKVYGQDGWVVIEEAAYTLLIDTLLEEPVVGQLEHGSQNLLLEGGSQSQVTDHGEHPEPVQQHMLCDENVIVEDKKVIAEKTCGDGVIKIKREECEEQGLGITGTPMLWQAQLGLHLARTPECADINTKKRAGKPCFGWISDDEDDEFLQLTPA